MHADFRPGSLHRDTVRGYVESLVDRARATLLLWLVTAVVWLLASCTGYVESPNGLTGEACGDVLSDPANCGFCGRACGDDQICDLGKCRAKADGCSGGRLLCGSSCVDGQTDARHCGSCNNACGANRTCGGGSCLCANGVAACGDDCADLQTDTKHCGGCNQPCRSGELCTDGSCVCPTPRLVCGDTCADIQNDDEHCGGCNQACSGGQICMAGQCVCPSGQQLCGGSCVDTLENDAHCGECNRRCELGATCSAGSCNGGGLGEDGCSGLAQNVTIEQIAVYQAVKVTIMDGNAEISPAQRNTDVVAGRDAMFRVFVTVGDGFSPRELSARIFVENGDEVDTYFAKQNISQSSTEASTANSFQILVPKDKITTETRYAVEIVECATGSGGVLSPRFPASDGVELAARETGVLKVQILPVRANGQLPDTSTATLQVYRDLMQAMYPVTDVIFTVGDTIQTGYPIDWEGLLDDIRAKREDDDPAADVYYYGLLKPTDTLFDFCGSGCTAGIGYIAPTGGFESAPARAAVGIGFADETSAETMVHEIGHNHGREHAPCVQGGTLQDIDPNYPYENARLGVWGYDFRDQRFIDPDQSRDIMSYCNNQWLSDYTYDALLNRLVQVNGSVAFQIAPERLQSFRVLLVSPRGTRWGNPKKRPSLPTGTPEPAEILDVGGNFVETIEVYRTEISDFGAYSIEVPVPKTGWHAVRVRGAAPIAF